jgi:hypothetical protein
MRGRFRRATAAGLIILAGCAALAAQSQGRSSPSTEEASLARQPSITIVTPKPAATIHGRRIRVSVSVKGFNPRHEQFRPPAPREGHVHFYLDVKTLPTTHMYPSPVPYRSISGTTYIWSGVRPGRHTVAVQLVGNDHVPLRPAVKDRVSVTVH